MCTLADVRLKYLLATLAKEIEISSFVGANSGALA